MDLSTGFEDELRILTDLIAHPGRIRQEDVSLAKHIEEVIAGQILGCGVSPEIATRLVEYVDDSQPSSPQILILTPSDECSVFAKKRISRVASWKGVRCKAFISAHSAERDQRVLSRGVQIAVGTLAKVLGLLERQSIDLHSLRLLVFDDSDVKIPKKGSEELLALHEKFSEMTNAAIFYSIFPVIVYEEFEHQLYSLELKPRRVQFYYLGTEEAPALAVARVYPQLRVAQVIIYSESISKLSEIEAGIPESHSERACYSSGITSFLRSSNSCLVHNPCLPPEAVVPKVRIVLLIDATSLLKYVLCMAKSGRFGKRVVVVIITSQATVETLAKFSKKFDVKMKELPSDLTDVLRKMTVVDAPGKQQ